MNKAWVSAFGFIVLMFAAVLRAAPVPDTGQTKCYDVAGNVIACPLPGQPLYGQDANYSINPMSYTKLDGGGNVLPDSATSWVMVRDNVTGLIWEMKTNLDGVANFNDPHDADNVYFWYDSNPATNGGYTGTFGNGTDNTEAFIKALNDTNFGGYTDWRLPTIHELTYIVDFSIPYPGPTIDTRYFPDTRASYFLSSTTFADGTGVWELDFNGGSYTINKYKYAYSRAVRGERSRSLDPAARGVPAEASTAAGVFTDNGDGTVTDYLTGLIWQKETAGEGTTLEQALSYCENLSLGGNTDWRLPTIKELRSLVDYSRYGPSIHTTYFPDTRAYPYWSSTTYAYNTSHAWSVDFNSGDIRYGNNDTDKSSFFYMRAVRGGQYWPLGNSILYASPLSQNAPNDAGTTTFSVSNMGTGTMPWTASVTSGSGWLSIISGDSGSNTGTILCGFSANTTMSRRTGTIRIIAGGATGSPKDVTVTQESRGIATLPIPDTGQAKCYDAASAEIACPSPGQALYGQDANYSINPMSYTKLDSSGNALQESATSWAMVRDNVTGLIWESKTDDGTIHDKGNIYTWYDGDPATNGGFPGTPADGANTESFITALNDTNFGGYTDWRLPTIHELIYIVHYGIPSPGPTIDTGIFPNTQIGSYWSSTTDAYRTDSAWLVDFYGGYSSHGFKNANGYYVRAVRGGQYGSFDLMSDGLQAEASITSGTYTDNGDGTITDSSSGLMWQQAATENSMSSWKQALSYCENLNLGGHTDWRLPTIKELQSLVDNGQYNPAINTTYFPDTQSSLYWSSTTYMSDTSLALAWSMYFYYGKCTPNFKNGEGSSRSAVRAVRGGQPTPKDASPVYRFSNTIYGGYLYTIDEDEKNSVIQNYEMFHYDGIGFYAFPAKHSGALPVHRFNNNAGGYFYTINEDEKEAVVQLYSNWLTYEGIGFYAFPAEQQGALPVHRFNNNAGEYFYTINEDEKEAVVQLYSNWLTYEGIGFYAYRTPTPTPIPTPMSGPCQPDINANGTDREIAVSPVTPVSVAIGLTSGDKHGKSADWWFAMNSPWGWIFLTTSGWTQIPIPLYQSTPLSDFSNQIMTDGQLPVGNYEFFFGVYIAPNDSTDPPLYLDSVKVTVK